MVLGVKPKASGMLGKALCYIRSPKPGMVAHALIPELRREMQLDVYEPGLHSGFHSMSQNHVFAYLFTSVCVHVHAHAPESSLQESLLSFHNACPGN